MTEQHQDFVFAGYLEESRPTHAPAEPKPRKPADIARAAASLAWHIRHTEADPTKWKALIDAADPDLRECLRVYLVQAWRELQERRRRDEVGKQSSAGDAAMAELAKRYGSSQA